MVICEIGQNHCGDMGLATQLICMAKDNGADLAKFQLYNHKALYGNNPKVPNVELTFDQAQMLFEFGKQIGIEVFFSVFDLERIDWCEEIGVKRYKVAGTSNNTDVLKALILTGKPLIISTNCIQPPTHLAWEYIPLFLYCVSKYPAEIKDYYFNFEMLHGISDHTIGLDACRIAFARGASVVEKHFAIDHKTGVDAEWSMTPSELKELKRFEKVCKQII